MFSKSPLWLFAGLLGVLALMVVRLMNTSDYITQSYSSAPEIVRKSAAEVQVFPVDPSIGASDAKLTIVEFSDFECPYCAEVAPVLRAFVQQNPGAVRLVWKDFPLPDHSNARSAAEAAQCAAQQGRFWQFHEALYANQSRLGSALYQELAANLKLDLGEFSTCLSSGRMAPLVERNMAEGTAVGVDGTPYFIINGRSVSGTLTEQELQSYLQ